MSGEAGDEILAAFYADRLTTEQLEFFTVILDCIDRALVEARAAPASLDRRCLALVTTKLEEAQHWAYAAGRAAAARSKE